MKPYCLILLVATFLAIPAAHAQDTESARAFVEQVYANFANPDPARQSVREDTFYSPELRRLIAADRRGHPGYVGRLDGDPICDCQDPGDPGELKVKSITLSTVSPLALKATVRFSIVEEPRIVTFSLIQTTDVCAMRR